MRYRTALIGCGRISGKHIEAYIGNSAAMEFAGACDIIPERASERIDLYRKNFPDTKIPFFTDYKKMLDEISPEIVTIATESGYHAEITKECLRRGCHVIVEKPMALSTSDAKEMISIAEKTGKKLAVCFQNRFNKTIQKVAGAIHLGRLGKILHGSVQVRWNRNNEYYDQAAWRGTWSLDGGALMNQCTHGIDLLQWLMDSKVVRVYGAIRRFQRPIEAEDFGGAILEFENGAVGMIEGTVNTYPKNLSENLSLFGETGTVVIGGLAVNKIETWRIADSGKVGDTEEQVLLENEADPPTVYGFGHTPLFRDFTDSLDQDGYPLVTGEQGYSSLEIILAIYRSMKEGRPVDLPMDFDTSSMKGCF